MSRYLVKSKSPLVIRDEKNKVDNEYLGVIGIDANNISLRSQDGSKVVIARQDFSYPDFQGGDHFISYFKSVSGGVSFDGSFSDGESPIFDEATGDFIPYDAKAGESGYSRTSGFLARPASNNYQYSEAIGEDGVEYTAADVAAGIYKVFSLDNTVHEAMDNPYWSTPDVSSGANVGLFNGYALPDGVTSLFDYTYDFDTEYPGSTGTGFEGSTGRIRLNDCRYGDQLRVRFDFNVVPQIANTTIEPALWYSNRDDNDDITFTFPLTTSPVFYGTGTVGNTYLNRVEISAWIISNEDVNALTLPAIKSDNPVLIQPLGLKVTIIR